MPEHTFKVGVDFTNFSKEDEKRFDSLLVNFQYFIHINDMNKKETMNLCSEVLRQCVAEG